MFPHPFLSKGCQTLTIDPANFPLLTRLVVKELIESSMKHNRMLDASDLHLRNFFALLENMLLHGIKWRNGLFSGKKDLWSILESIEKDNPQQNGCSIADIVWQISNIKTTLGKCRAWLRLAFVQKHLPDSFRRLVEKKSILMENYEPDAFILSENAVIVAGYLIGLNIIDLTWYARDGDLDGWNVSFDFKPYLKDIRESPELNIINGDVPSNIELVLDQKNYLEELNRNLSLKVIALQRKLTQIQPVNDVTPPVISVSEDLSTLTLTSEEPETTATESSTSSTLDESRESSIGKTEEKSENEDTNSIEIKRLDSLLSQEKEKRMQAELRYQAVSQIKSEREAEKKLLEKDIREKQETIISLVKQIEDTKIVNTQLSNKARECDSDIKAKMDQISELKHRNRVLDDTLCQMIEKISSLERSRVEVEHTNERLNAMLMEKDQKRTSLESELKKEKDHRKSLQTIVDEQQEQITSSMAELERLKVYASELERAKCQIEELSIKCSDYELSLEEVGAELKKSKLEADSLKETAEIVKDAVWTRDQDADECVRCGRTFSVTLRKHHCRNCGQIFCIQCSDNKLPLPSSSKPVRVCDGCHTLLLERYSAN
ncbi:RUN and FYVE domain-containing protein 1-like isoform X2 [Brevipalpus obovatus]|uniref:RUN and FYVE domain-containing protein 1-like isoform X2 n=1 Tax=Brevipalpus obovatus TaxID=246614 RepID=UPI003D9F1059